MMSKSLAIIVTWIILWSVVLATPRPSWALHQSSCGDLNGDGTVTVTDALAFIDGRIRPGECPLCVCDVDGSGQVTADDALFLLQPRVCVWSPCEYFCPRCCGSPITSRARPTAADCLEILRTAVGIGDCGGHDASLCDVDAFQCGLGTGQIDVTDALRCLNYAVRNPGAKIGCEC